VLHEVGYKYARVVLIGDGRGGERGGMNKRKVELSGGRGRGNYRPYYGKGGSALISLLSMGWKTQNPQSSKKGGMKSATKEESARKFEDKRKFKGAGPTGCDLVPAGAKAAEGVVQSQGRPSRERVPDFLIKKRSKRRYGEDGQKGVLAGEKKKKKVCTKWNARHPIKGF